LKKEWRVGRVIARPYITLPDGSYKRTTNRHDYALDPTEETVLNYLQENKDRVISVGKIQDIFNGSGIDEGHHIISNHDGMEQTTFLMDHDCFQGLLFVNLVDFDALYGHRRDVIGYYNAMVEFDRDLKNLIDHLKDDDLLMITADHGNDPTWYGTDHTREYVPILVYNKKFTDGKSLGIRSSFSDIGATISENFKVQPPRIGESFLKDLK